MASDFDAQVSGIAALGEPVRRALYMFVTSGDHDVSRDEAAEALDLPRSVAAFHLDKLVDEGLLSATYRRIGGREGPGAGRPSKLYRRGTRIFDVTLPPRRYELAARMLAGSIRPGASPEAKAARRSARAYGSSLGAEARRRAGARPSRRKLLASLVDVLTENGFEPLVTKERIRLRNCPFDALAADYRDLVCGMNLALQEGVLASLGVAGVDASPDAETGFCCVGFRIARGPSIGGGADVR
jgi:predicted ArsR family transcriptional regulator